MAKSKSQKNGHGRAVAIVAGLRTPFVKSQTAYRDLTALDLGRIVVSELVERAEVDPKDVEQLVYGQVVPSVTAPNIAREIVLGTGLPMETEAYSVSRACATSYQSTVNVAQAIATGQIDGGVAGGADSASDVPISVSAKLQKALLAANAARSLPERVMAFKSLRPMDLLPVPPALEEPSTGESMGQAAERMAKENGIGREAQDELAHRSHTRAAAAWADGKFADEVMSVHVPPRYSESVTIDGIVRKDGDLAGYAKLKPVFDRKHGSVTAANSSPLTDGASAVLLMAEDKAKALGLPILGRIVSYAFAALDPGDQLLLGPAFATPKALDRAGMTLRDMDLVDMHEAFAAQVLSVVKTFESDAFARDRLGRSEKIGDIDWDAFNVNGGSIAIGHPFAATGARQITQTLNELARRGGGLGLCTACAAGGLGAAMILEVDG